MKIVSLLTVLVFGLMLTANAQNQGAEKTVIPYSNTITSPCNGEVVQLEGTFMAVFNGTLDGDGGSHVTFPWNIKANGVGSLGNEYSLNLTDTFATYAASGDTFAGTRAISFVVVGQGQAPNILLKQLLHITITSNGELVADISTTELSCKG